MKKKVLLVATVQSHIAQFHRPLANLLHKHEYEVHVAAKNNLAEKNGLQIDFADKIYDLPFARSPKSKDNYFAYKQLKKILDAEKYDVVHCNTPMGGIVTRLAAKAARKKGTKVIYTAHGFHFYKGGPLKSWICYYPIEKLFSRLKSREFIILSKKTLRKLILKDIQNVTVIINIFLSRRRVKSNTQYSMTLFPGWSGLLIPVSRW